MQPTLTNKIQAQAYTLIWRQLLILLAISLVGLILAGFLSSLSLLCGGLVYVLTNLCFVCIVFRYTQASQNLQFLIAFYFGEILKVTLSGFLLLMIVKYLPLGLLSTVIGFIGAIVAFWIACLWQYAS